MVNFSNWKGSIVLIGLFVFVIQTGNSQRNFQVGFSVGPTCTFSNKIINDEYFRIAPRINLNTGVSIQYFPNEKFGVTSGVYLTSKKITIEQKEFDDLANGQLKHIPGYHCIQIPLMISLMKSLNDNHYIKYSMGLTADFNNFDFYKIQSRMNYTADTLRSTGYYLFSNSKSFSLHASLKLGKFVGEVGAYEFGFNYNHTFSSFAPIDIVTTIGNSSVFNLNYEPRLSYFGIDFTYSPYFGNSIVKAFSLKKPTIYLMLLQGLIFTSIML